MLRSSDGRMEYVKGACALGIALLLARLAGIEQWGVAGLAAFLSGWGLRLGAMMSRSTGRRHHVASGALFSIGAACLAVQSSVKGAAGARIALAAAALAFMLASIVVSQVGRRNDSLNGAAR